MSSPVPLSVVDLPPEAERLVLEVLRSGRLAQGPMVERLEQVAADTLGATHVVAVSSGTTALVAAIETLDLRTGDEVLTSPFTFVATLNAILEAGAVATFADVADDLTIAPDAVESSISRATRVVMPVHLYGYPADMTRIARTARAHGLAVVEDAAQAHGASVGDCPVGTFGIGCFSLYATKNVTAGEGGLVTTDDEAIADRVRLLRNQGMRTRYEYEIAGHNYRMTELQAAVGVAELGVLAARNAVRRRHASALSDGLRDVPGLRIPEPEPGREHVWHQYTVRVTGDAAVDRDELARRLAAAGIETGVYYPRVVFDYDCYRDHPQVRRSPVPNAQAAAREVLSLPVSWALTDSDLARVVEATRRALGA